MDLPEALPKHMLVQESFVVQQLEYEAKHDADQKKAFDEYATEWWNDFKQIRESHKKRLVPIFAETDDRDFSYCFDI